MNRVKQISVACIIFFLLGAQVNRVGATEPTFAERAALKRTVFDEISLSMAKSLPPQFDLTLERKMPSTGSEKAHAR